MAWRDREYARESDYAGPFRTGRGGLLAGRSIVSILITLNIAVFLLTVFTIGSAGGPTHRGEDVGSSALFQALALKPHAVIRGQIWRLLTAQYLHWTGTHLLLNMLGLYFLGKSLERIWTTREFLGVYTV